MIVIKQKIIKREDLKANPRIAYLFGDNYVGMGYGGQAKEMRGEPNAIGIPTKLTPTTSKDSYLSDEDFSDVKETLMYIYRSLTKFDAVVIPMDGIGTGLAKLEEKAPKIQNLINQFLEGLETR